MADEATIEADLDALITGGQPHAPEAAPAAPPPLPPEPVPPAANAAGAPAAPEEAAPAAPAAPAEPLETRKFTGLDKVGVLPKRTYTEHMTPEQKEVMRLMLNNPDMPADLVLKTARGNLNLTPAAPDAPGGVDETPPPEARTPSTLEELAREIEAVDTALDEQAEADGVGTTFNREIKQLLDKKQDLLIRRLQAELQAAQEAARNMAAADARNNTAVEQSLERYPDLRDESSPFFGAVMERFAEYEALAKAANADPSLLSDPDTALALALYEHPDFSLKLADEVAREQGLSAATPKAGRASDATQPPQGGTPAASPPPAPKAGMVPLPGSRGAAHRVTIAPTDPITRLRAAAQAGDAGKFESGLDELIAGGAGGSSNPRVPDNGRLVFVH